MLHYILQVIFFQLSFLLVYELLLKKETFFHYNRWYLLLTPVMALLLPLLKFEGLNNLLPTDSLILLPEVVLGNTSGAAENSEAAELVDVGIQINWWWLFYSLGMLLSILLFIRKSIHLRRLFQGKILSADNEVRIIQVAGTKIACTFYNTVFLGDELSELEKQQILSHELVHVRQKHSLDLVFFELLKIIFWFNPLIYVFQSKIAGVHEFIADSQVIKSTEKKTYYQQLLNTAFNTENISFINQFFNHSLIKKRIVMLQKSKSKSVAKAKYLILVPLMLVMLTYVSCSQENESELLETEKKSEQILTIEVENFKNQSPEEKAAIKDAISGIKEATDYNMVVITDGNTTLTFSANAEPGSPNIKMSTKETGTSASDSKSSNEFGDVPFAVIEEVPIYPGCEDLASNKERKECMSEKITTYVNKNFNTTLGKEQGLTGVNRIYVQFRIEKDGEITVLGARAPNAVLEEEARRVINGLPEMIPGKQKGKKVGVLYSLPIVFNAGE